MLLAYYILSALFITVSLLPYVPNQHWSFRVWEFGRIQIMIFLLLTLAFGIVGVEDKTLIFCYVALIEAGLIVNNAIILFPYTFIYKRNAYKNIPKHTQIISIISVNVYQFNEKYEELIKLVREVKPDILLTIETNQAWEDALNILEDEYPTIKKVPLENTYGMHFYTKLAVNSINVNYFVAEDLPSIEASLQMDNGTSFTFFGVHPPPPSPTEEDTSKERDGELLSVGKRVKETKEPVIVVGDFNNVAWAKSSILFRKTSELIDPRIGRGFVSTYHAKYRLFRFPIDLFFHSTDIFIEEFTTLRNIGSDHLPLYCKFFINHEEDVQEEDVETLEAEEKEVVDEMIEEGIEEESDRKAVVKEE